MAPRKRRTERKTLMCRICQNQWLNAHSGLSLGYQQFDGGLQGSGILTMISSQWVKAGCSSVLIMQFCYLFSGALDKIKIGLEIPSLYLTERLNFLFT